MIEKLKYIIAGDSKILVLLHHYYCTSFGFKLKIALAWILLANLIVPGILKLLMVHVTY